VDLSQRQLITRFTLRKLRFDCEVSAPPGRDPDARDDLKDWRVQFRGNASKQSQPVSSIVIQRRPENLSLAGSRDLLGDIHVDW
jgi:hypothetical protein